MCVGHVSLVLWASWLCSCGSGRVSVVTCLWSGLNFVPHQLWGGWAVWPDAPQEKETVW